MTIVAVSKQQSADSIALAYAAGIRSFGENYLQEALPKIDRLTDLAIDWHFIGAIQSNKTKVIAERFAWVHTVDRSRIAERLNERRPEWAPPLNVLIQVNLAAEPQKGGVAEDEIGPLAEVIESLPKLLLRGLMTLPPADQPVAEKKVHFSAMRDLLRQLHDRNPAADTLSMGMSSDFELAVACGSNMIRIGTALFGPRPVR